MERELTALCCNQFKMGDSSGAGTAAAKTASQGQGVFKRLLELLVMMISALLVVFAWDTAGKAQEENTQLRQELRLARAGQAERTGTRCTVCLDQPREVLIQPCGHVVSTKEFFFWKFSNLGRVSLA